MKLKIDGWDFDNQDREYEHRIQNMNRIDEVNERKKENYMMNTIKPERIKVKQKTVRNHTF